ncbi:MULTISPECIES: TlpA disulfide reductase family protein [Sphingobacteriaceae]|uniref:Redoxin domain protein n=1 Tax=Sphingobacterium sp. (strain 21) TaxID=743722 RepID=F4C2V3_SPHS2
MFNNKEISTEKSSANKFWQFVRKNAFSILIGIIALTMLISPGAKSMVLRQLMLTGLFNASIDQKSSDATDQSIVDFDFEDDKGRIQNTSSLRGKVVFINFWASWCPPCRAEFPSIEKLYANFKEHPAIFFLTINEDKDLATAYTYLKREKYSIPIYRAKGNVPASIYAGTLPTTVVLDKNGKIRFHHTGFANYASDKFNKQLEELIQE